MAKKIILIIVLAAFIVFVARFFVGGSEDSWICEDGQWVKHGNPAGQPPEEGCGNVIVGGDRDEHGCIGSAGYTWCEAKGKCLRVWEEKCE